MNMYKPCTKSVLPKLSEVYVQSMYNPKSANFRSYTVSILYVCTNVCTYGRNVSSGNHLALSEAQVFNTMIQSRYILDPFSTNQNLISNQFGRSEAITLYGSE